MTFPTTDLFALGQQTLAALLGELAEHGVYAAPGLELRRGAGLLCYYDLNDGNIYLSIPDPETPRGKFELLLMRSVMNLDHDDEILRLLEVFVPWFVAHETAHHLRHRSGLYGANLWEEEWVANRLAMLYVKRGLTPVQNQKVLDSLVQAMRGLPAEWTTQRAGDERDPIHYLVSHMRRFCHDLLAGEVQSMHDFVQIHLGTKS